MLTKGVYLKPKIYVAGHHGMVGSAIVRTLKTQGQSDIIICTKAELDLTNQAAVNEFFAVEKPSQVYLAAAKVGGIHDSSCITTSEKLDPTD